jgi:hypothetical protein
MQTHSFTTYEEVIHACQVIFEQKTRDYGTAWRILRLPAITDQLMIKAQRIRTIQEKGQQRVADSIATELIGIVNYSLIALIQMDLNPTQPLEMSYEDLKPRYEAVVQEIKALLDAKNHDYGEAWKEMRVSSMVDIILMKLLRVKRIEDNQGSTLISEGVAANYQDILNYAVFALLKTVC